MARLSLSLLGSLQVTLDGQPITGIKSAKVRALLAFLAVEADRPHRREVLAGLLWPDMPDGPARSNLRDVLANLRTSIGDRDAAPRYLVITRATIQFNTASDHWLDVAAFESLVAGPTAEEKASGADSFFSADTSGMVVSAAIDQELLVVDFEDLRSVIPNASTSCGSMALLAQLNTTAFQFDRIERVRYQIEGSCDTFANWLQRECMEYTRNGAQPAQP